MNQQIIETKVHVYKFIELEPEIQVLINKAKEQINNAYAPYSNFYVGAAVLLQNGALFEANNQENAAFPSGLCAERVALFYANAQYPNVPVKAIAVAAFYDLNFVEAPITPCGACRQVLLESEIRFENEIDIYMYGKEHIYHVSNAKQLLPLSFGKERLEHHD
ncbi:MAG: cytidine deaminase [Bacteroidales bacterium 36-12]|jgi:cytidine deaminase|nr:MAG: cytidine deaminase [Bacteroidales bacterium 36-12]